jgi:alcohol dehydrogenase class IV
MVATLPAKLVAYTGMDALTHAIESYVSTEHQPLSDALAMIASEMIFDNIEAAVKEPGNTDARAKMQIAALMAGIAFSNAAVGAVHAIAHTVGGIYGIHHGLSNGVALPYVMEFNLDACATRYASLSRAFGVTETGLSDIELGRKAIERVRALKASIGIPERFRELNVPSNDDAISVITEGSLSDLSMIFNPRPADFDEFKPLVEQVV